MSQGEIAPWYAGRSVFITGATGFMGKVLVEKLLYGCPDINNIYILTRGKRGRSPEQRIEDMWTLPMFHRLRTTQPNAIKKVIPIDGDLVTDELGISKEQRSLLIKEVSVVFHMAATLRLEGTLKDATEMNVSGTQKMIDLSKEMTQLKAFVHLSTAFCNCDVDLMKEETYSWRDDPHEVMRTVKWMKNEALIKATPDLIKPHPNTYTYSKRLSELLIAENFPTLPVTVVRPAIVSPAANEPVAGWVDNLNGPIGLLVGGGKGVIRSMLGNVDYPVHSIPVDLAINAIIAIGWKTGIAYEKEKPKDLPIYNLSQDGVRKMTCGEIFLKGREIVYDYPFEWCIWYPGGEVRTSKLVHWFYIIFLHFLPAYFLDFLLLIFGQKRFMVRLQWKILQGLELLQFFTTRWWKFDCTNFVALWDNMSEEDRSRFSIDLISIDYELYLKVCILGARQYCVKEDLSSLPRCRLKQKFLYVLDKIAVFGFYYMLLSFLALIFPPIGYAMNSIKGYASTLLTKS